MPNKLNFEIDKNDYNRLIKKLHNLEKFDKTDIHRLMNTEAKATVDRMWRKAPFDTGRLRRGIDFEHLADGIEFHSEAIEPGTNIDYAPVQEYGSRYIRPQPYFFKNIRKFRNNLRVKLINRIQDIIIRNR